MGNIEKYMLDSKDLMITDSFSKADSVLNSRGYKHIQASISGGADSDILLDLCEKTARKQHIRYTWFDTGLEYEATKEHISDLERQYHIRIDRVPAVKPIPLCCHAYGVPFLSKYVSSNIERLQRHNFKWEDLPYSVLIQRYPKCSSSLKWWCNAYTKPDFDRPSRFSIDYNRGLKDFMIAHPPEFKISSKCCTYAKKQPSLFYAKQNHIDLSLTGVRKSEGGIRATAYSGCFSAIDKSGIAQYRPLFWYANSTKKQYEAVFGIQHSRCYTAYGMKRTGCAGCPYNRNLLNELAIIEKYENKLYHAICNIFHDSYRYTRIYRDFVAALDTK